MTVVFLSFLKQNYFHKSSIAMGWKFPSAMSFSPWRTMSSSSAIDITSASLACFCEAMRLSDLTAFFIRPSSSEITWRAPKSSELSCSCTAVITSNILISACKDSANRTKNQIFLSFSEVPLILTNGQRYDCDATLDTGGLCPRVQNHLGYKITCLLSLFKKVCHDLVFYFFLITFANNYKHYKLNYMKKILLQLFLFLLPLTAIADNSGSCGENLTYTYVEATQTLTISGTGKMNDYYYGSPWQGLRQKIEKIIIEEGVTSIGLNAFGSFSALTSVSLPNSLTAIGKNAFRECSSLVSITIPDGVSSIDGVFYGCTSLASVTLPSSLTSFQSAFHSCTALTSITIPDGVTTISTGAFYNCTGLTTITIPNSVTSIESIAFMNCSSLASIAIPDGVTTISSGVFEGCSSLALVTIPDGVKVMNDNAFSGCSSLASITIPEGVTSIPYYAFQNCTSLTSITIPANVTSIGRSAFEGCSGLTSITIPYSVISIGQKAFSGCSGFESVKVEAGTPPSAYDDTFSNYSIALYAPETSIAAYQSTDPWSKFASFVPLAVTGISINETNFPDENFRLFLLAQPYGADAILTAVEISGLKQLDVSSRNISDLKGIEHFTSLLRLECQNNQIASLDLSGNTELTELNCSSNRLPSLNVSANTALVTIGCMRNSLTTLDVSNNTALQNLICVGNKLTKLDLSNNVSLSQLSCFENRLSELILPASTTLETLDCGANVLTSLDLSNCPNVKDLNCRSNKLTELSVPTAKLATLNCQYNQIESLDLSQALLLSSLTCRGNKLTTLDVSNNVQLSSLDCIANQLTALDVSNNDLLHNLSCSDNKLSSLKVSPNSKLASIDCQLNQIKGNAMNNFVISLPQNDTETKYNVYILYDNNDNEGNVCTTSHVSVMRAKGWEPWVWIGNEWRPYDGSYEDRKIRLTSSTTETSLNAGDIVYLRTYLVDYDDIDADIYYTLDGSTPSEGSTKYTPEGIKIEKSCTLKAIAFKEDYETSDILSIDYVVNVVKYVFSFEISDHGSVYIVDYKAHAKGALSIEASTDVDIQAVPDEGYKVEEAIMDGEDIMSQLQDAKVYHFGKLTSDHTLKVSFTAEEADGITPPTSADSRATCYSLQGIRSSTLRKGLNIVRTGSGTTRKLMVK